MAQEIRVGSTPTLRIGPFVDVTDANTADAPANIKTADYAVALKEGVSIAVNIKWDTWAATNLATHFLDYTATNAATNTVGQLDIMVADADVFLPVHKTFEVVNSRYYDFKYCGNAANILALDLPISTVNTAVGSVNVGVNLVNTALGVANHRFLDLPITTVNTAVGVANHRLLDLAISAANASMGTVNFKLLDMAITAHNTSVQTVNFRLLDGAVTTVNTAVGAVNVGVNLINTAIGVANNRLLDLAISAANASMGTANFKLLDLAVSAANASMGTVNFKYLDLPITAMNTSVGTANFKLLDVAVSAVNTTAGAKDTQIGLINTGVYQTNALVDGIGLVKGSEIGPIPFFMTNSADHISPATLRTVWVAVSGDGTAFANVANAAAEMSDGWYKIWLDATETTHNWIAMRAVNANCDTRDIGFKLES